VNVYTVTTFGPREYLQHIGRINVGELTYTPVKTRAVTIAGIQQGVALWFGIPLAEMTSDRRSREVARPRQVAMYLSKLLTPRSLPEIGRVFGGRDHTTVIHAIRQIDRLQKTDPKLRQDVVHLTRLLSQARRGGLA